MNYVNLYIFTASGVAPLTAKNLSKIRKKREKIKKKREKREKLGKRGKIGKVLSLCPS